MMAIGRNTEGLSPLRFSTRDRAGGSAEEPDSESPLTNHSRWRFSCQMVNHALRVLDSDDGASIDAEWRYRYCELVASSV